MQTLLLVSTIMINICYSMQRAIPVALPLIQADQITSISQLHQCYVRNITYSAFLNLHNRLLPTRTCDHLKNELILPHKWGIEIEVKICFWKSASSSFFDEYLSTKFSDNFLIMRQIEIMIKNELKWEKMTNTQISTLYRSEQMWE